MFNLFRKKPDTLVEHRFKKLLISLPSNWEYSMEEGDQQACFDPKSQSTLRINIVEAIPPHLETEEKSIALLTDGQPYTTTLNGCLLTSPVSKDHIEDGNHITLITWRLINIAGEKKILAILTYTVLSEEKDSVKEKGILDLIENTLNNAGLIY